jgi:U3 small nucleolar ribonucleoprotein component
MTGTIFSNLPNNLIMNIIKMAEDQRKKEEQIQNTKKKFNRVIYQIDSIFGDPFFFIREFNDDFIILENGKYAYEQMWDEEINALQQEMEYNHPPEYAYDWGDDDEPSWACE